MDNIVSEFMRDIACTFFGLKTISVVNVAKLAAKSRQRTVEHRVVRSTANGG